MRRDEQPFSGLRGILRDKYTYYSLQLVTSFQPEIFGWHKFEVLAGPS